METRKPRKNVMMYVTGSSTHHERFIMHITFVSKVAHPSIPTIPDVRVQLQDCVRAQSCVQACGAEFPVRCII